MFGPGDRVRILGNNDYSGKEAVVVDIHFPFGLHTQYELGLIEPFFCHGYLIRSCYVYDWENILEFIK